MTQMAAGRQVTRAAEFPSRRLPGLPVRQRAEGAWLEMSGTHRIRSLSCSER